MNPVVCTSPSQQEGERQYHHHHHRTVESGRPGAHGWGGDSCACGKRPLAAKAQRDEVGTPRGPTSKAAALPTGCRSCLARRGWMDPFSARMLSVACRKVPRNICWVFRLVCLFAGLEASGVLRRPAEGFPLYVQALNTRRQQMGRLALTQ